jgi:hypothetical protein
MSRLAAAVGVNVKLFPSAVLSPFPTSTNPSHHMLITLLDSSCRATINIVSALQLIIFIVLFVVHPHLRS